MNTKDIIELILGSGGLIGILFLVFRMGRFAQKLDNIDKNVGEIKHDIKGIQRSITSMEIQIGKLETRVEERTLRVVKDIYESREPAVR